MPTNRDMRMPENCDHRVRGGVFAPGLTFLLVVLVSRPLLLGADDVSAPEPAPVRCLSFSPDSRLLAASTADQFSRGALVLWSVDTWQPQWEHREPVGFPRLAFSPDGKLLALSRFAPETKLFDVATGQPLRELKGHTDHARCVTFTPDGDKIITGSYDRTVKIWDVMTGDVAATLEGHPSHVYHVAVSPDGSLLVAADARSYSAHLWHLPGRERQHIWENFGSLVPHADFSPDGRLVAVSSLAGSLQLFDTATFERQRQFRRIGAVSWSAFSPDQRWLALATNSPNLYLFPANGAADDQTKRRVAELVAKLGERDYEVRRQAADELAAIGPAAEADLRAALQSPDAEVRWRSRELLRRMSLPESALQLQGHQAPLECVGFSPDGQLLASGDRAGRVIVWSVGDWQPIVSLVIPAASGP